MTGPSSHQALYRRWRAQRFAEIVGQDAVVETLRNAVRTGRVSHALLFTGPRGTGKTSLARIVAKALNCTDLAPDGDPCDRCPSCVAIRDGNALDVIEIDAASNRGIDAVKALRETLAYAPAQLRRKVYILDEAHQITKDAWNALLKSLEEPPEFVTFMFASTHPQEFPPAILSRLQRFEVRRLTVSEIGGKLARILEADERVADPDAIELIAKLAAGGMRDAESILDQLLASTGDRITADGVRDLLGLADADAVDGFVDALAKADVAAGLGILDRLEERGRDLRVFLDQVVDGLRDRLISMVGGPPSEERAVLTTAAHRFTSLDPTRVGPGGIRLRLELALLGSGTGDRDDDHRVRTASARIAPAVASEPAPLPNAQPTGERRTRAPAREPAGVPQEPTNGTTPPAAGPADPTSEVVPTASTAPSPAGRRPTQGSSAAPDAPAATAASGSPGAPAPSASIPVGTPDASADLQKLREGWTGIVASVGPAVRAVIMECRPLSVDGPTVTLGFPESKAFLKDIAERKRGDLESAVGGFLARPVAVICVATNLDLVPPMPGDDDAARILDEAQRIFADDLVHVPEVD